MRNPDFPAMAKSGLRTYKQVRNPDFTPRSPGFGLTNRCVTRTWPKARKTKSGLRTYKQVRNPDFTPQSPG
jgi:hypothetical protein